MLNMTTNLLTLQTGSHISNMSMNCESICPMVISVHVCHVGSPGHSSPSVQYTLEDLVAEGLNIEPHFVERRLAPREAKTKVAFLSFSSGTTGRPKVCNYANINS